MQPTMLFRVQVINNPQGLIFDHSANLQRHIDTNCDREHAPLTLGNSSAVRPRVRLCCREVFLRRGISVGFPDLAVAPAMIHNARIRPPTKLMSKRCR